MQGRGFDPLYWETFAECMTQAAVEWEANRQRPTLGAWRTLVSELFCAISASPHNQQLFSYSMYCLTLSMLSFLEENSLRVYAAPTVQN